MLRVEILIYIAGNCSLCPITHYSSGLRVHYAKVFINCSILIRAAFNIASVVCLAYVRLVWSQKAFLSIDSLCKNRAVLTNSRNRFQ